MWPKTIIIRGIPVQITSWEEFDEIADRYGSAAAPVTFQEDGNPLKPPQSHRNGGGSRLDPHDRTLLRGFVDNNSVATEQIAQALGKKGKAIRSGLDEWGRKIGLTDNKTAAFERCFRTDGRGYRLLPHFKEVAKLMLNE